MSSSRFPQRTSILDIAPFHLFSLGATATKKRGYLRLISLDGDVERRAPIVSSRVNVCSRVEQKRGEGLASKRNRFVQRSPALCLLCPDIRPVSDKAATRL